MSGDPLLSAFIFDASIELAPGTPLHVYLVKGQRYAVWIDSGIKSMFPLLLDTMKAAGVADDDLRFILHTHSHHDHMGCNAQLQDKTGCLIAAHPHYAAWHRDFELHYQQFARPFPDLAPDTPDLREEVLAILDQPRPLDLWLEEGMVFDLGGNVMLEAIFLPGHLLAEFGWFEASSRTLILGDAVTGLDWLLFHSHLSVQAYRASLDKIEALLPDRQVRTVLFAHFPAMPAGEVPALLDKARDYLNAIEVTLLRILAAQDSASLARLWSETCRRMGRRQEFRALNMVHAHVLDLIERRIIRETEPHTYQLI